LNITARGFAPRRIPVQVRQGAVESLEVTLDLHAISDEVTVTADAGLAESAGGVSQQVNIIGERDLTGRAKSGVAQAANEEVGVHLQRTSPTISGIFVRGLTGNKVNVFVDGVRYSTSAARGGISTFLNLITPSNLDSVEILRGPNSAQYGSDAIGGSLQFILRAPPYSPTDNNVRGSVSAFAGSQDASFGSNLTTSFATKKFGLIANLAAQRINTLRPGRGIDSHNAVTRYLGLGSDLVIGSRLPDTAFTQYGGLLKMHWTPAASNQITASYTRGQQDGGRRYDQLLGGDGNLIAELRNLMLDFFYVKYDRVKLGWADSFTLSFSINSQREERVNQGGSGNPLSAINHEYERTTARGLQAQAGKQLGAKHTIQMGGDFFYERISSPAFSLIPATGAIKLKRPRVPSNARYLSGGLYLQDVFEAVPGKLRLTGNIRYSAASYRSRAQDSPIVDGERLWRDDSLRVGDMSFRAGVVASPVEGLHIAFNASRGFRAPHMTDMGTLGLTGSGFEVAAPDVAGLGATIGTTADANAVSTRRPVSQVEPETSISYDIGVRYRTKRFDTEIVFFINDVNDNITKQSLILPPGAVGLEIGGQTITAQNANGAVFVEATTGPVLARANFDDGRIYGFEHEFDLKITREWELSTIFTYLKASDRATGLAPNIEGGTPAPDGYLKFRYSPAKGRYWIEPYIHAAGRQERISSLALEDRRTGASRSRASIASFFFNGATARGLVSAGRDGRLGTADDLLIATGETLAQIQNRVLGAGVNSAPLFTAVPGYATFNIRGGFKLGERHEFLIDFENIADRNYRGVSWGVDGGGRGVFVRYSVRL
jgi:outer membrane receptor protein involved in Fe transport